MNVDHCHLLTDLRRVHPRRHHAFDQQELAVGRYSLAAILENGDAALIIPIVNDVLENIFIGARRHGAEEVSRDNLASLRYACSLKLTRSTRISARKVEDNAAQLRLGAQDGSDECAIAAADIDNRAEIR